MPKIVSDDVVFSATIRMVTERGYSGATTKLIADAADISEVTLFRKYGNKAQLVKQAIVSAVGEANMASAAKYTGDLAADLLRVLQAHQYLADKTGKIFVIMLTEIPHYPELASLLELPLSNIGDIGKLLSRYQTEGQLQQEEPAHAVAGLLGPLISITLLQTASAEIALASLDLEKQVERFLNGRKR